MSFGQILYDIRPQMQFLLWFLFKQPDNVHQNKFPYSLIILGPY